MAWLWFSTVRATARTALPMALGEALPESSLFAHTSKSKRTHEASTLAKEEGCCLWGIQHLEERLSQSQLILEVLNNAVAFTGGFFEFPAVHNLHCTSDVIYDSVFLH
jgi:hypothetical protein